MSTRRFPSGGRTRRWSFAIASAALLAAAGPACDDDRTQGPEPDFAAQLALVVAADEVGGGEATEIFAVARDGRRRHMTTGLRAENRGPAISPDGKAVVFMSRDTAGGSSDLYRSDVDGGLPVRLTRSAPEERQVRWSPRGDWIAYVSGPAIGPGLEIIRPDGTGQMTLMTTTGTLELGSWSPDGSQLVVAVSEGAAASQIVTLTVPAGEQLQRTAGPGHRREPAWSPEYSSIAYVRDRDLWSLRLGPETGTRYPVALDSVSGPLSWTTDGRSLVLTGWTAGRNAICRVDLADSTLAILTQGDMPARDAAVLPDGRRIVYVAFTGVRHHVFTMDLQGFGQQRVTEFSAEESGPVARPVPYPERIP